MKIYITMCLLFALTGCSGSGIKSYSTVASLADRQGSSLFVLRDTGFVGSAALITVTLNGQQIAEIGNGETAIGKISSEKNYVTVAFSGIQSTWLSSSSLSFNKNGTGNKYFIIKMNASMLSNSLQLLEVTEASFRVSAQNM